MRPTLTVSSAPALTQANAMDARAVYIHHIDLSSNPFRISDPSRAAQERGRLRVGLNISAHVFRPLPDAAKADECSQGAPTPQRWRSFSRNLSRAVGSG